MHDSKMASDLILFEKFQGYNVITLNQPETFNAFSKEMISAILDVLRSLKESLEEKPLIITGTGKAFSSGGNLGVMKEYVEHGKSVEYIQSIVPFVNEVITLLFDYRGPTLAIMNGHAVGGGLNLAMACDFRIVHEKAKFKLGFIDIGLTPATGNSFFIPKMVGIQRTLALSLFSESISAQDLYNWGLANEIYSDYTAEEEKTLWIKKICSLDPRQVYTVRSLLYKSMRNSLDQQMELEYTKVQEASNRSFFKEKVLARWKEITEKK